MCRRQGLSFQTMAGGPGSVFLPQPASGLSWHLSVRELAGEVPLQAQGVVSGGRRARHLGCWGWRQAQGRGESGQVIVYIEAQVVPALRAGGSLGPGGCLSPGPPLLGFAPLVACDDGERVDEEDLDDLNDADDGAAHPQAQLATDVGQKHLDLQGRPSQTIRRDPPAKLASCQDPSSQGSHWLALAPNRFGGKWGQPSCLLLLCLI